MRRPYWPISPRIRAGAMSTMSTMPSMTCWARFTDARWRCRRANVIISDVGEFNASARNAVSRHDRGCIRPEQPNYGRTDNLVWYLGGTAPPNVEAAEHRLSRESG